MDVNKVLKIVTSHPVLEASREVEIEPIELMKFYNKLESLLRRDIRYSEIGDKLVFLLALVPKEGETGAQFNVFEGNTFVSKIKDGLFDKGNILLVDSDGDVIKHVEGAFISDHVEAAEFSEKNRAIVFFIEYRAVHFFVNGKPIDYIHDILQYERKGVTTPKTLPAREYRQLITNQYNEVVYKEQGITYWKNKANRILVDRPEIHFNRALWWYLDQNIVDAKVDRGATISGMEDRTDIRILAFESGELYIIEIKCLGRTASGNCYSDDWANHGVIQINLYLKDESDSTRGTLVIYDGRKDNRDIVWCTEIECSPKYDNDPMTFYLESESASVKAKRIISNLKKKAGDGYDFQP